MKNVYLFMVNFLKSKPNYAYCTITKNIKKKKKVPQTRKNLKRSQWLFFPLGGKKVIVFYPSSFYSIHFTTFP